MLEKVNNTYRFKRSNLVGNIKSFSFLIYLTFFQLLKRKILSWVEKFKIPKTINKYNTRISIERKMFVLNIMFKMFLLCSTEGSSFSTILKVALQRYNILIVGMIATILKIVNVYNINSFASYNWKVLDEIFLSFLSQTLSKLNELFFGTRSNRQLLHHFHEI